LEDFDAAQKDLLNALEMAVAIQAPGWQVQCLPAAALIAANDDQLEHAAELLALGTHHPAAARGWLEIFPLVTRLQARLESELSPESMTAAWNRGKGLDLAQTVDSYLVLHS
jgi:hypothetical protein